MKSIGVIGGMGSLATHYFFGLLIAELQKTGLPESHWPEILIDNCTHAPSRTRALKYKEDSPASDILLSGIRLETSFVVVPCNSAHYWRDAIIAHPGFPEWLDMIGIVSEKIMESGCRAPLVLGGYVTSTAKLYSNHIPDALSTTGHDLTVICNMIALAKKGEFYAEQIRPWLAKLICDSGCDSVLLGCTELPMHLAGEWIVGRPLFDSASIYAEAAVRRALGK